MHGIDPQEILDKTRGLTEYVTLGTLSAGDVLAMVANCRFKPFTRADFNLIGVETDHPMLAKAKAGMVLRPMGIGNLPTPCRVLQRPMTVVLDGRKAWVIDKTGDRSVKFFMAVF